jgi:hypothetical protein
MAAKKLTLAEQVALLKTLVVDMQTKRYHEPDSDLREYCADCGNSPYNEPQHKPGCFVPRIRETLKLCK